MTLAPERCKLRDFCINYLHEIFVGRNIPDLLIPKDITGKKTGRRQLQNAESSKAYVETIAVMSLICETIVRKCDRSG